MLNLSHARTLGRSPVPPGRSCEGRAERRSPAAASAPALIAEVRIRPLTAWNDGLFQARHERGCCLLWQPAAGVGGSAAGCSHGAAMFSSSPPHTEPCGSTV